MWYVGYDGELMLESYLILWYCLRFLYIKIVGWIKVDIFSLLIFINGVI